MKKHLIIPRFKKSKTTNLKKKTTYTNINVKKNKKQEKAEGVRHSCTTACKCKRYLKKVFAHRNNEGKHSREAKSMENQHPSAFLLK